MKRVFDSAVMQTISLFEYVCGVHAKDCMVTDQMVVFVVPEGEVAKAVGKGGTNVRKLEQKLRKKIKVVEFNSDALEFVKRVISPLEVTDISEDAGVILLVAKDLKTRGLLIGRNASNLRFFESIVKRFFPVKEIKVR